MNGCKIAESPELIRKNSDEFENKLLEEYAKVEKVRISEIPNEFNENPIRPAIMAVLRQGIKDKDLNNQRYALNAREIIDLLEKDEYLVSKITKTKSSRKKCEKISYTNLYFHLNKLEEVGAIRKMAVVIEKNHRIAYYGRTAHVIINCDPEMELKHLKEIFNELARLLETIHPQTDIPGIEKIPESYYQLKSKRDKIIGLWLANNHHIIKEENLNLSKLFKALKIIDTLYPEYKSLLNDLSVLFNEKE